MKFDFRMSNEWALRNSPLVEEEADECVYSLSLLEGSGITGAEIGWLKQEADEIAAIMVASRKTARNSIGSSK